MRSQPVRRRARRDADPAKRSHPRVGRFAPARYVARVDRSTGLEIPGPIAPEELIVHANRDLHPVKLGVRVLASRVVEVTGSAGIEETLIETVVRYPVIYCATAGDVKVY